MVQIQKRKKRQDRSRKKDSSEDIFYISFNHREIPKKIKREKSWQDVSVNLYENISTGKEIICIFTGNIKLYIKIHI